MSPEGSLMNAPNRLIRSIRSASRGIGIAFQEEQNFRIQACIGACSILLAFVLQISLIEWGMLVITMGAVLTAEIFNSVLERIVDAMKPRVSPLVRHMKDLSSAAVLILASSALVIGCLLFLPRIISFAFH